MDDISTTIALIAEWAWIGWLVLIALFLVIEMLTLDFTFLMLALGSAVGLVSGLLDAPIWLQFIIAGLAATVLILFIRPPLLRRVHRSEDPTKSNVEALIGLGGFTLHEVTAVSGQVKLSNGDIWTARTAGEVAIPQGAAIAVDAIHGATAIVRPAQD
ncbi:NfeD family protein [Microbacterium sp. NIBRBAC000506063]|uniref:NfeD family protein n=1 Tax=Microbacterium sp. NIBRBAC000506063 TaxID=2734618 RepID=UPI001CB6EE27|nr:NfeD family protein [Microbacterium sp. NIBRBAC000506063]